MYSQYEPAEFVADWCTVHVVDTECILVHREQGSSDVMRLKAARLLDRITGLTTQSASQHKVLHSTARCHSICRLLVCL